MRLAPKNETALKRLDALIDRIDSLIKWREDDGKDTISTITIRAWLRKLNQLRKDIEEIDES